MGQHGLAVILLRRIAPRRRPNIRCKGPTGIPPAAPTPIPHPDHHLRAPAAMAQLAVYPVGNYTFGSKPPKFEKDSSVTQRLERLKEK